MKFTTIYSQNEPVFSFEFSLPKKEEAMPAFWEAVEELRKLSPSFVSLTYGAMGSRRNRTFSTAGALKNDHQLETAAHLTAVSHTRSEIDDILDEIESLGIQNIVALRGDLPQDGSAKPIDERDFPFGADLVRHIARRGGFDIAVAGYPETHPEAVSPDEDLRRLKEKVDAGASVVITQLFFENRDYFDFVERAETAGITVPIVPGIMPVTNARSIERFSALTGSKIPLGMRRELARLGTDPEGVIEFGIDFARRQCEDLLLKGAPGLHFYTLNKTRSTHRILEQLRGR